VKEKKNGGWPIICICIVRARVESLSKDKINVFDYASRCSGLENGEVAAMQQLSI